MVFKNYEMVLAGTLPTMRPIGAIVADLEVTSSGPTSTQVAAVELSASPKARRWPARESTRRRSMSSRLRGG